MKKDEKKHDKKKDERRRMTKEKDENRTKTGRKQDENMAVRYTPKWLVGSSSSRR